MSTQWPWGAAHAKTSQNALSTTAEQVAVTNGMRRYLRVKNTDEAIVVYYGEDDTVSDSTGSPIGAGESEDIESTNEIWMIAASGTPTVALTEVADTFA